MSDLLPFVSFSKLPARDILLAEIEAFESRAEAVRQVAEKYGVYSGTVRRHIRGVQGQGSSNASIKTPLPEFTTADAPESPDFPHSHEATHAVSEEDAEEETLPLGGWHEGDRYVYNGDIDTYTFFLRTTTRKQVLPGTQVRAMKRAYSNMGEASTINEIARSFSMRRDIFSEIKTILGWTHDSDAFTDEEILTKNTSSLVEDAVQMRRSKLDQEFNRRDWRDTQRDADRYRNLEHFLITPLLERVGELTNLLVPAPMIFIPRARRDFAVLTSSGELHYNKHGWVGETGETYTREIADRRLELTTIAMISEIQAFGRPQELIYIVGNDDMHTDGAKAETTAGTPQDVNGTGRQMLEEFYQIQVREIERLSTVAAVRIVLSAGNHNTFLAYVVMKMLAIQYRDSKRVTVELTARMRSYVRYGNSLLGVTHGHQIKSVNLMATMGVEAREHFSATQHKYWFTGHRHTMEAEALVGGTRYQQASLSGLDIWHVENGYFGMAGLSGYVIDALAGVTNTILCPAVDGIKAPSQGAVNRYGSAA